MAERTPLLQEIRNQFDTFESTPADRSQTNGITITAGEPYCYQVTTYPNGYEVGGFSMEVLAGGRDSIFGEDGPVRVRMDHANGRVPFGVEAMLEGDGDEAVAVEGAQSLPTREHVAYRDNDGFELFGQLHDELRKLREPIAKALGLLALTRQDEPGPVQLTRLQMYKSDVGHSQRWEREDDSITLHRQTDWLLGFSLVNRPPAGLSRGFVRVFLDGSLTEPRPAEGGVPDFVTEPMVYRAGTATWYGALLGRAELDFDCLTAFAGLHANIQQLYR